MKTKYTLFRRGGVFYAQESATGKQTSLRTKDETEAKSLLNARNEAQRQPVRVPGREYPPPVGGDADGQHVVTVAVEC